MTSSPVFSVGFNHDEQLIDILERLNSQSVTGLRIGEVFSSIGNSPIPSARVGSQIPRISESAFVGQVRRLKSMNIAYNYLFNAASYEPPVCLVHIDRYISFLLDAGIERVTVNTIWLIEHLKRRHPRFHVTMSITAGIDSKAKLCRARDAGADAAYLCPVKMNRDFEAIVNCTAVQGIAVKLYANVSCISNCPVVTSHYGLFRAQGSHVDHDSIAATNAEYFSACTQIKLLKPVEWIQMPWIRPEDIRVYAELGVSTFKLSDRLATTSTLRKITESYMTCKSPNNLADIIERDYKKYEMFDIGHERRELIHVDSRSINCDFIQHFKNGSCKSRDTNCRICLHVANNSVRYSEEVIKTASLSNASTRFRAMQDRLME
jgi:collagenase-like PrtC family protease